MATYYIFDVDGTLTHPRKAMEHEFALLFEKFCCKLPTVLATGSDLVKLREQVPESIRKLVKIYTCNGAENLPVDSEICDPELITKLQEIVDKSNFYLKVGNHIERRSGMINLSTVGRNASDQLREKYTEYDYQVGERKHIVEQLTRLYPHYQFRIGGAISIDITKQGIDKSLVAKDILAQDPNAKFVFYGDRIYDGNDQPLAEYICKNNLGHTVSIEYPDTFDIIASYLNLVT